MAAALSAGDFAFCGILGEGEFGRVMMGRSKRDGELYAIKVLRKSFLLQQGGQTVNRAISEKEVLQELASSPHPYIVSLLHCFQDSTHLLLVMDFVGGGDLHQLLEQVGAFSEAWTQVYSAEVVLALEHLHGQSIIYRDLKPENLMVSMDGHLKLTDFGFAKHMPDIKEGWCTSRVGTPEYMAPEVIKGEQYSLPADWWSLGCLVYEMLCGCCPFNADDELQLIMTIKHTEVRSATCAPTAPTTARTTPRRRTIPRRRAMDARITTRPSPSAAGDPDRGLL